MIIFRVSLPKEETYIFEEEISVDIRLFGSKADLANFTMRPAFSNHFKRCAWELYARSAGNVWSAFTVNCCTLYTGSPNQLWTDRRSLFVLPSRNTTYRSHSRYTSPVKSQNTNIPWKLRKAVWTVDENVLKEQRSITTYISKIHISCVNQDITRCSW